MKDLLTFYSNAIKTLAEAPTGHVPAIDRTIALAQTAIATEQAQNANNTLLDVIKALILPGGTASATAGRTPVEAEILAALTSAREAVNEPTGPSMHPSPFSMFDPDAEQVDISEEDRVADEQLKARIKGEVAAHLGARI